MNYKDLGYSDYLTIENNSSNFIGTSNALYLEGVDSSQVLSLGRIESPRGNWYLDFDNEKIELPNASITTAKIKDANITNAKIEDASITNAKIDTVSMDKLTAGTISVVGNLGSSNLLLDGQNERITFYNSGVPEMVLGEV